MSADRNHLPFERTLPNDPSCMNDDETFIEDWRNTLRPAQRVEQKLVQIMGAGPLCISQLETFRRPNER